MYRIFRIVLLLMCGTFAHGQEDKTPPLAPVLTAVSVIPSSGFSELWWQGSPSEDVTGYILYRLEEKEGYALDTIWDRSARYYLYTKATASFFEVQYVVAAIDTAGNISPLSNPLNTLFLESRLDTCASEIKLNWNRLIGQEAGSTFEVWYAPEGMPFSLLGETEDSSFVYSNFESRREYCFYIRTENGNSLPVTGNQSCLRTDIPRAPDWIEARASILQDDGIVLHFLPDPQTEIRNYALLSVSGQTGTLPLRLGNWSWDGNGELEIELRGEYADTIRYFQLGSLSSCDEISRYSDTLSNLILRGKREGEFMLLEWNVLKASQAESGQYELIRRLEGASEERIPIPGGFEQQSWQDPLSELIFNPMGHTVTYRLRFIPTETGASASLSNAVELELPVQVFVPTAFTPDGNMQNEEFRPVLSFSPREYELQIRNRRGTLVFHSRDPLAAWDGHFKGRLQPEGAYIWQLKITTLDGLSLAKAGQISLLIK